MLNLCKHTYASVDHSSSMTHAHEEVRLVQYTCTFTCVPRPAVLVEGAPIQVMVFIIYNHNYTNLMCIAAYLFVLHCSLVSASSDEAQPMRRPQLG